ELDHARGYTVGSALSTRIAIPVVRGNRGETVGAGWHRDRGGADPQDPGSGGERRRAPAVPGLGVQRASGRVLARRARARESGWTCPEVALPARRESSLARVVHKEPGRRIRRPGPETCPHTSITR